MLVYHTNGFLLVLFTNNILYLSEIGSVGKYHLKNFPSHLVKFSLTIKLFFCYKLCGSFVKYC